MSAFRWNRSVNHLEPRPRQRNFLADANPPDEGWHTKTPGPEQGQLCADYGAFVPPRSGSLAYRIVRFTCPDEREIGTASICRLPDLIPAVNLPVPSKSGRKA